MSQENTVTTTRTTSPAPVASAPRTVAPPVDVYENAEEILLLADLPGVRQEDLDLQLDQGELTFSAERSEAFGAQTIRYRRAFSLPDGLDPDRVRAELKHGVLYVHLGKSPEVRPRRIEVKGD